MALDPSAIIDPSAKIHNSAEICAYAVIGANVEIGAGTGFQNDFFTKKGFTIELRFFWKVSNFTLAFRFF